MLFQVAFDSSLDFAVRRARFAGILYKGTAFAKSRNDIFDIDI
jgi:hypothetical protein